KLQTCSGWRRITILDSRCIGSFQLVAIHRKAPERRVQQPRPSGTSTLGATVEAAVCCNGWILIMASVGWADAVPSNTRSRLAPASAWTDFATVRAAAPPPGSPLFNPQPGTSAGSLRFLHAY